MIVSVKNVTPCYQDVFRECCVMAMSKILDNKTDEATWKLFFLISRFLLQLIRRGGKSGNKELKRRFKLFKMKNGLNCMSQQSQNHRQPNH